MVAQAMQVHQARGVDELVLLDVRATAEGRGPDLDLIATVSAEVFAPLSVGGGVTSPSHVLELLRAGADKVVIGTAAWTQPGLVRRCADLVGCQAIVVSLDVGFHGSVMTHCGTKPHAHRPVECAVWAERQGAGEILLQSIDRDGSMVGYDLQLVEAVSAAVGIPVIASGGGGNYGHMAEALLAGASAVAAGAMFQFTDQTPRGAAKFLAERGIEVRV